MPRLPPREPLLKYVHVSPEYYINAATGVVPRMEHVSVLHGNVNLHGNTGNDRDKMDVAAHGWYFGPVGACSPAGIEVRKRVELMD